jgi:GTP pyrophosphokinase
MADVALADLLIQEVSTYLRPQDVARVEEAIAFTRLAHGDQKRQSGDLYVTHPIEVARILAKLHLDLKTLVAALLHDVVEDTDITTEQIAEKFGVSVSELVEGLSKLDKLPFETREDAQAENFRKMLMAMAKDVRVVLIKLADRLHNMRTLGSMPEHKRERIAEETLQIYAQIAYRMGLHETYQELQELSFQYLHPEEYKELLDALTISRGKRQKVIETVKETLESRLKENGIVAKVEGRQKSYFSIYKKMREKSLVFNEVLDVFAYRVLVKTLPECYLALGVIHGIYKPKPGKFKDYIAIPKENGYQSLHSTLMIPPEKPSKPHPIFAADAINVTELPIEVQIRTQEMHKIADVGVASHWLYKSGDASISNLHQQTHQWLQDLLERLNNSSDSAEFMEHLRVDLFPDEIYVFTHKGHIRALPRGATALDFAYHLHQRIGERCYAVQINYKDAALRTALRTGDRVEIFTGEHSRPKPEWLNYVTTSRARSAIRHYCRTVELASLIQAGKQLFNRASRTVGLVLANVTEEQWARLLRLTKAKSRDELMADIGLGKYHCVSVAQMLAHITGVSNHKGEGQAPIVLQDAEDLAVKYCKICNPIPGDPIVGELVRGQGLLVHMTDCPTLQRGYAPREDWVSVKWGDKIERVMPVKITVLANDQPKVLGKVASIIGDAGFNIENLSMSTTGNYAELHFTLEINHRLQLKRIMDTLSKFPEVVRVTREKAVEVKSAPKPAQPLEHPLP